MRYRIAWEIGKNPSLRHGYVTDQNKKAATAGQAVKRIIKNERYRAVFPNIRILTRHDDMADTNTMFTVSRVNLLARDATFFAFAIHSLIQGYRFDRLWGDDMCSPQVQRETTTRNRANSDWENVIIKRLDKPALAKIHIICTPWHSDDVAGRIVRQSVMGELRNWRIEIDCYRIKDDPITGLAIPIWEKKHNTEWLENEKLTRPIGYDLLYRLQTNAERRPTLRRVCYYNSQRNSQMLTPLDEKILRAMDIGEWQLSIDPTATANDQSSDCGIIEGVITEGGHALINDAWLLHKGPVEIQEWIIERILAREYADSPYKLVIIESQGGTAGIAPLWINAITIKLKEKGCTAIPNFVTPTVRVGGRTQPRGKMLRLVDCSGYVENGFVRFAGRRMANKFLKSGSNIEAIPGSKIEMLCKHLLEFDGTNCPDWIDAFTQFVLYNQYRIKNTNQYDMAETKTQDTKPVNPFEEYIKNRIEEILNGEKTKSEFDKEHEYYSRKDVI
jgi:hypothetical protein